MNAHTKQVLKAVSVMAQSPDRNKSEKLVKELTDMVRRHNALVALKKIQAEELERSRTEDLPY